MPSFKAVVDGIASTGALFVTVESESCIPEDLGCNIASVNVGLGPIGIYVLPQALTIFPLDTLDDFELGQKVKISWRAEGNLMTNLKIRATT
ncbi:MAG TPA: hypothetical protein VMG12_41220 [Polyangiaceae bacterium]|nr:hypothetical protein [Polyangiaceae bacterium]